MARTKIHSPPPPTPKAQPRQGPNLKFRQVEDPRWEISQRAFAPDQLAVFFRLLRRNFQLRRMIARQLEINRRLRRENDKSQQRLKESRVKLGLIRRKYFLEQQGGYIGPSPWCPHWYYIYITTTFLFSPLIYSLVNLGIITDPSSSPEFTIRILFAILALLYILVVCWDIFVWPILPDEDLYILRNLADFAKGFLLFCITIQVIRSVLSVLHYFNIVRT